MELLEPLDVTCWQGPFSAEIVTGAADALEAGRHAPRLYFDLSEAERRFLSS
jgi:hypothetical protein